LYIGQRGIFAGAAVKGGDDEGGADSHAITVVEKALEIFSLVSGVIKTSTRAGGHVRIPIVYDGTS
jgi:hypothetical protein